jgi:predicted dehydrogenase
LASHLENFGFKGENYFSHFAKLVKNLIANESGGGQVFPRVPFSNRTPASRPLNINLDPTQLRQFWPRPSRLRPIVIIGAGDIVRDAHLPAYRQAGFPVAGVFDLRREVAEARAKEFNLPRVFASVAEAIAVPNAVFDLGVPPKSQEAALENLPDGAAVLSQKPMGNSLEMAKRIVAICERKKLHAAVNFQFRFCPSMLAIQDLVKRGELGELVEIEVRLNIQTPWETFPFLYSESRVEIQVHTVHYLDTIRMLLGEPSRVFARTVQHPHFPKLASTRSSIILDYGDMIRCCLSINHCHPFGPRHQAATFRVEGTEGCAIATMGASLDYPRGQPDRLEVFPRSQKEWVELPLSGRWFPDAFIGTMSNLQRFVAGEDAALVSPVADALQTMKLVEACYVSDARGGIHLESIK